MFTSVRLIEGEPFNVVSDFLDDSFRTRKRECKGKSQRDTTTTTIRHERFHCKDQVRLTTEIGAIASHNPKEPRNVLCVVRPTQFVLAQIVVVAVAVAVAHTRVTDRREKQPSQRKQGSTHHWGDAKSVGSDLVCFFLWVKDENKTTTDDQQPRPTTAACVGVFLWLSPFLSQSLPVTRRSSRLRCTCCHLALDTPIGDGELIINFLKKKTKENKTKK